MTPDVLQRFRTGVAAKKFTLTRLAKLSGVPLATLSDWSDEEREPKIFDRFEKLAQAMDQIEAEGAESETAGKGRESTAA